jgi:chromate transport protein ChrA
MVGSDIVWEKFRESPWRAIVSHGLAPAIVGLVWASVYSISRGTASGLIPYTITALVVIATLRTKLSAPLLIGISGLLGMVLLRQ